MKTSAIVLCLCAIAPEAHADGPPRIAAASAPSSVTVHPDQASVTRTASVRIPSGDSVVVLGNVPVGIVPDSVKVRGRAVGAVVIGSVETRRLGIDATALSERMTSVQEGMRSLDGRIQAIDVVLAGLDAERVLLERLSSASAEGHPPGAEGMRRLADDPSSWKAAREAIRDGMVEIGNASMRAKASKADLVKEKTALEELKTSIGTPSAGTMEIAVSVSCDAETPLDLDVSYQVPGASWHPVYEARLDTSSGRISFDEEAVVSQRTGEDWSDVALALSTTRPSAGVVPPSLKTWRISLLDASVPAPPMTASLGAGAPSARSAPVPAMRLQEAQATRADASVATTGLSVEYVIAGRAGVPADGSERRVGIARMDADAVLGARTVPRIDQHAYMTASFTNPSSLAMLPGTVTLYMDGTLTGRASIGTVNAGEKMELPFGVDDRIKVSYAVQDRKQSSEGYSVIGTRKTVRRFSGLSTIVNFHDKPIQVTSMDQAPTTGDGDIAVQTQSEPTPTGTDVDDRPGVVSWTWTYAPKEEKRIRFGWQVTAPEGRTLVGLGQ